LIERNEDVDLVAHVADRPVTGAVDEAIQILIILALTGNL